MGPLLLASVGFMPAGPRLFSYQRFAQNPLIFLPPEGRKKDKAEREAERLVAANSASAGASPTGGYWISAPGQARREADRWRAASYNRIVPATEAFNDSTPIAMGTEQIVSAKLLATWLTPRPSLPTMNMVGLVKSIFQIDSPSIWATTTCTPRPLA